jgi:hypothetical protein
MIVVIDLVFDFHERCDGGYGAVVGDGTELLVGKEKVDLSRE